MTESNNNQEIIIDLELDEVSSSFHDLLNNRDLDNQHPINAITGLQDELDRIPTKVSDLENDLVFLTEADIPTKVSDLENDLEFASISEVPTKVSQLENDSGFISEIPAEYVTERELAAKSYISSVPDYYVTEDELANRGYISSIPSEYITESELEEKGYLTEIPSHYVTEKGLEEKGYLTKIPSIYVTENELHDAIRDKAELSDIPTKVSQLENDAQYVNQNTFESHIENTFNPHNVTKTQVGLGRVDNTSDLEKPISLATQEALDEKVSFKELEETLDDYATIRDLDKELAKKPDAFIKSKEGVSRLFNAVDGSGSQFVNTEKRTATFVGIHNDEEKGPLAQIYSKDIESNEGARLNVSSKGIFYTNGKDNDSFDENDEIITKKDLEASLENTISEEDLKDYVRYENYGSDTRKTIRLENHDVLTGNTTDGKAVPLAMLSRWNVADFGNQSTHTNINTSTKIDGKGVITVNDTQAVLTDRLLGDVLKAGENVKITQETVNVNENFSYNTYKVDVDLSDVKVDVDLDDYATKEELKTKVNTLVESEDGKAKIFNEKSGGGAQFDNVKKNTLSYVGVNNGNDDVFVQIYSKDKTTNKGARLAASPQGIFYTNGEDNAYYSAENELVTRKDLEGTINITKVSQLENDSGFITEVPDEYVNEVELHNAISEKADKSSVYTKTEVDNLINTFKQLRFEVVDILPDVGEDGIIYLLPREDSEELNGYNEYIWIGDKYEYIGSTNIEVDDYVTKDELDAENISYSNGDITSVQEALDQLLYKAPTVTLSGGGRYEIGQIIDNVKLSWVINKDIITQSINQGIGALDPSLRKYTVENANINSNTTYTITINDGKTTKTSSTSITFMKKVYWGVSEKETLTNDDVLTFNSEMASNRQQERVFDCSGGKYFYFAIPAEFCNGISFKVNEFLFSDMSLEEMRFINASGYESDYHIYRCNNIQTGSSIKVEVL